MAAQDSSGVTYIFRGTDSPSTALPGGDQIYPGSFAIGGLTMVTRDQARTGVDVWVGEDGSGVLASELLVTGDRDGRVYLWNAATGALLRTLRNPGGRVDRSARSATPAAAE